MGISTILNTKHNSTFRWLLTATRLLIGWHFLYEGVSKLFSQNWSASGYLLESHWFLSSFFHWIASHPTVLRVVDFMNIWGLILIGLGLFLGIFTRLASIAGAFLILLYYIANPPLVGFLGESTSEGSYLIVNKNLIEMCVLLVFIFIPQKLFYGIDRIISRLRKKDLDEAGEIEDSRRTFLKDLVSLPLLGGFAYNLYSKYQWESFEERSLISKPSRTDAATGASPSGASFSSLADLNMQVPHGQIGHLKISRLICGGNLISGYAHSRDLIYVSSLVQSYFSDEKVLETFRLCEACGINTVVLRVDKNTLRIMEKYRKRNGKIQWIAQAKITEDDIRSDIDAAIDSGADAVYIHGGVADDFVARGKIDLLEKGVAYIKNSGVLAGMAGHNLAVMIACEKIGLDVDFYMKTLNSGNYWTAGPRLINNPKWRPDPLRIVEPEFGAKTNDNIWSITPEQTVEFMKTVQKPWIAYKVLGAGAISPKEGFSYAFENGADFVCVGMFDYQVVEDSNIVNDILADNPKRIRGWIS